MPLAPNSERADVDKGDVWTAVVALGQRGEKRIELGQEDRVLEIRLPEWPVRIDSLAHCEVVSLCAGLVHPFRRRIAQPRLTARYAQRDLLALVDPSLRGIIEHRPIEFALGWLQIRPWYAQI